MKHLVIGLGEVGKSLQEVLKCDGIDLEFETGDYDIIHICFPYSDDFIKQVELYEQKLHPMVTVIHSTVPVGTTRKLQAVHSPIHGIHPNLTESIKTFVKYIGATDDDEAHVLLDEYRKYGIKGYIVKNPETSELSKLGCTTRHGLMIMEQKLFKKMCDGVGADFQEAYTQWNGHYSEGYRVLGLPYVQRAIVKDVPGKIGGHCIIPNLDLIGGDVANFIKTQNEKI